MSGYISFKQQPPRSLILAANTAFADFPAFPPPCTRQVPAGSSPTADKLVFSNGIIILAIFASILIVAFAGDTSRLIPLCRGFPFIHPVPTGMVMHCLGSRQEVADESIHEASRISVAIPDISRDGAKPNSLDSLATRLPSSLWRKSLPINLIGAIATAVVLMVFVVSKFTHGAWLVVVTIPILVLMFMAIHRHYVSVARQLSMDDLIEPLRPINHTVIVPISGLHRGVLNALQYARSISPNAVTAVYVDFDEDATAKLKERWEKRLDVKLVFFRRRK
jgi:hypothetical protein